MFRTVYGQLLEWADRPDSKRKPLLLQGARQVGKSWLMEELGKNRFDNTVQINFEKQKNLRTLFDEDFDVRRIMTAIQIASGEKITAGRTLIILDEIQKAPGGLLALKYLHEEVPQYHIAAAGSLLGVSLRKGESFPVGKVNFINVYPMTFVEFLRAAGDEALADALENPDWALIGAFRDRFISRLKTYYYVGGMPEAVRDYVESGDVAAARSTQLDLLQSYNNDFSLHVPADTLPRVRMVWDSIPGQLAKENKKFIYGALKPGSRAKEFEAAIGWLSNAGAVHKLTRCSKGELPLKGYEDKDSFKLYCMDIGILGAMAGLDANSLINGNEIFAQYKGALTEQYVFQQLICDDRIQTFYWTADSGIAELDFVLQYSGKVIPLEVKAELNLKAKSLKSFREKYNPPVSIRASMADFKEDAGLINLPLYGIAALTKVIIP